MANSEAVTQQDFALFKQEMKSDFALFKQEMKSEYRSFQDNVTNKIEAVISKRINIMATLVVGLIGLFIIVYTWYFETTHNSINQINQERALLKLEEAFTTSLNKRLLEYGVAGTKLKDQDTENKGHSAKIEKENKAKLRRK